MPRRAHSLIVLAAALAIGPGSARPALAAPPPPRDPLRDDLTIGPIFLGETEHSVLAVLGAGPNAHATPRHPRHVLVYTDGRDTALVSILDGHVQSVLLRRGVIPNAWPLNDGDRRPIGRWRWLGAAALSDEPPHLLNHRLSCLEEPGGFDCIYRYGAPRFHVVRSRPDKGEVFFHADAAR